MKILTEMPPEAKKGQLVSLDFETFGQEEGKLHRPTGTFACISVAIEGDKNTYQLYDQHDLKRLVSVISKGVWVFDNAVYDLRQFRRYVPNLKPRYVHDTMLADQAMRGGYYRTFSLADLSRRWLGEYMEKGIRDDFSTATEMTPQMKKYAALDAVRTLEIAQLQLAEYQNDPAWKAYTVADEPMIWPVLDLQGFRVDVVGWETMVKEFERKGRAIEDEIDLNVWSYGQVKERLAKQEKLHLLDTKNDTLVEHADRPLVAKIIEARMYRKASSTYGMKWLETNVESDGKVYSNYKITGAETGRMSSSNPNMQNIPQRKLPVYRERFLASPGSFVEIWDVSQQEPSITAYHSQDRKLLEALRAGESLHLAVAREIYDNPKLTKADKLEYSHGKAINLGLTYGLTSHGLARRTGMSEREADVMISKYFRKYSGVKSYIDYQRQVAYRQGYVTTALGRRAYINPYDKTWMNNAINSPIQGGAGDFTKVWARKIWEKENQRGLSHPTNGFIHDEITRDTPKEIIRESGEIVQEAFHETAAQLYKNTPFVVDGEVGNSWAAKSIEAERIDLVEEGEE